MVLILFIIYRTSLLEKVRSDDPVWRESGTAFINSVTRLLERLLDYRNVMQGDENCDKRMSCTVNLLVSEVDQFIDAILSTAIETP